MNSSNENLRKNLRTELRKYYGSINEIALQRGCTREWVRLVLRDEGNDDEILRIAAKVLEERKAKRRQAEELVSYALTA